MATRCALAEEYGEIAIRFGHDDSYTWRLLKDDLKDRVPGIWFDGDSKTWYADPYHLQRVRAWAHCWFRPRQIIDRTGRRSDHYHHHGYAGGERQYDASKQLTRLEAAYQTLCLLPTAPDELVASAHRILARLHHPDVGGDHVKMVAINNAADTIKAARP
jgi:hypothetical protein